MDFLRKLVKPPVKTSNREMFELRSDLQLEADGLPAMVAVSRNGQYTLAAAKNGQLKIWDTAQCQPLEEQKFEGMEVSTLAMDGGGRWAIVGGSNHQFQGVVGLADLHRRTMSTAILHERPVLALDISPDGKQIASGALDWVAKVADPETLDVYLGMRHPDWVYGVRFTPSGKELISVSWDWTIKTVDIAKRTLIKSYECEPDHFQVQLSPDGTWLAAQKDQQTFLVDTQSGLVLAEWELEGTLMGVNTHPTHGELAWVAQVNLLCAYSPRHGRILFKLPAAKTKLHSFSSALDGKIVAVGTADGTVRIISMP